MELTETEPERACAAAAAACLGLHRISDGAEEHGLSNCNCCSPVDDVSVVDETGERMKTRTTKNNNSCCSMDCNRKTPLPLNDIQHSSSTMNSHSNALMDPEKVSTSTDAHQASSSASASCCIPSNLHQQQQQQQQRNVSSQHHPGSGSASREDMENEIFSSDDREFDFLKAPLLPRSSSLKSRKTPPPGVTSTHRKSVRFADALGLDLELVRHILHPDEPPDVPSTAMRFLQSTEPLKVISYWRVSFPHPATTGNLTDRVLQNKVSLESCSINNSNRRVYGTVRVANVAYEKSVRVRYSLNGWLTCDDVQATYIEHSNDLITDRFFFEMRIPEEHLVARSRLEFAVRFSAANQVFWDNNFNRNYALECVDYSVL